MTLTKRVLAFIPSAMAVTFWQVGAEGVAVGIAVYFAALATLLDDGDT